MIFRKLTMKDIQARCHHKEEDITRVDNVDRSGYMPLDLQYARLMNAGKTLEQIKDYTYNEDLKHAYEDLAAGKLSEDAFRSQLNHRMDKIDIDNLLKDYKSKLVGFKDAQQEYTRQYNDMIAKENERAIRQDAINEYKKSLETPTNSN